MGLVLQDIGLLQIIRFNTSKMNFLVYDKKISQFCFILRLKFYYTIGITLRIKDIILNNELEEEK